MEPNNFLAGSEPIKTSKLLTKSQKRSTYLVIGIFILSSVGSIIFTPAIMYAWFLGAVLGVIIVVTSFIGGIVNMIRKRGANMFLSSILLFIIFALVGGGACA